MKVAYCIAAAGIVFMAVLPSSSAFWRDKESSTSQADRYVEEDMPAVSEMDSGRSDLLAEIERLQNAFSFFRQERDILKGDIEKLRADKKKLQDQNRRLESQLEKSGEQIEKLKKKGGARTDGAVERLESQLKEEQKLRSTYQLRAEQMEREVKALQSALAERDAALSKQSAVPPVAETKKPREVVRTEPVIVEQVVEEIDFVSPAREKPEDEWIPAAHLDLVAEANTLLAEGKVEEAKRVFREALSVDPGSLEALIGLAACSYTEGQLVQAKSLVTRALASDPENAQALGLHGIIMWRDGDTEQAVLAIDRAISIDGSDAQLHNYLGIVRHDQGDMISAAREFGKAVALDPEHVEALFNLSVVLATSPAPKLNEARKHYETALRLGSERNEALEDILYP